MVVDAIVIVIQHKMNATVPVVQHKMNVTVGVNRANKRKCKGGCGCKLCKPHKGKWAPFFKTKDKSTMNNMEDQINEL
jgi:hypothetical protein